MIHKKGIYMKLIENYYHVHIAIFNKTEHFSGLGSLALRLFLVPIFWVAGMNKLDGFENIVEWFGNSEWGLGLPFPSLMAGLATGTEIVGALLLLLGLAIRWITIPLMVTMLVAIFSVHWENGWQATHDLMSWGANTNAGDALERLSISKDILREHGNYEWLTAKGGLTASNNGIEFGTTYFVMLLMLFFSGGGRYFSVDYFLKKHFSPKIS